VIPLSLSLSASLCPQPPASPSRPALPPLAEAGSGAGRVRLQLSMRCDYAQPGELGAAVAPPREQYAGRTAAFRDMVLAGDASACDLVRAVLLAFGLADRSQPLGSDLGEGQAGERGGKAAVLEDDIVMLQDVVSTDNTFLAARIAGLEYVDHQTALVGLDELRVRPRHRVEPER
jgi:hypothetical protein